jgi:hypothetical protein
MLSGTVSACMSESFLSLPGLGSAVGEVETEEAEAGGVDVRADGVEVEDEEARGDEGGCAGAGVGEDTRACFLRLRQGLSSEAESLRRRFVRARACSGGVDTEADADPVTEVDASRSDSGRGEVVRRFAPEVGSGDSVCRCCSSGDGEAGGELRGDDAG